MTPLFGRTRNEDSVLEGSQACPVLLAKRERLGVAPSARSVEQIGSVGQSAHP